MKVQDTIIDNSGANHLRMDIDIDTTDDRCTIEMRDVYNGSSSIVMKVTLSQLQRIINAGGAR